MEQEKTINRYLEKTMDSYRLAVKALSRDSLIVIVVFLMFGMFTVIPFVTWSEKEKAINKRIKDSALQRQQLEEVATEIKDIQKKFNSGKKKIKEFGSDLAEELSFRLSQFAIMISDRRKDETGNLIGPTESFPGASMTEQFSYPLAPSRSFPTLVFGDFGLSQAQVKLVITAAQGTSDWEKATEIVKGVFYREIVRTYSKLNEHIKEVYSGLEVYTERVLDSLHQKMSGLGAELPTKEYLIGTPQELRPPADNSIFRTRGGKVDAFQIETLKVSVDLDNALKPFNSAHNALLVSRENLEKTINALKVKQNEAQDHILRLQEQFEEVGKQIANFSIPLKWLPFRTETLVRLFPTIISILFLFLVFRFSKLGKLRGRLEEELEGVGLSGKEIDLALDVPESSLDLFSKSSKPTLMDLSLGLVTLPVAVFGFLLILLWKIESSAVFRGMFLSIINVTAVAATLFVCGYFLYCFQGSEKDTEGPQTK
jgi:hypothetical protein